MRKLQSRALWSAAAMLLFPGPSLAAPAQITACAVAYSGGGVLAQDLDCAGESAITISSGTLDLNGFTLSGGAAPLISCGIKPCRIYSSVPGGRLLGDTSGLTTVDGARVRIEDLELANIGHMLADKAKFKNVTAIDYGGIHALFGLRVENSTFTGSTPLEQKLFSSQKVLLRGVTIAGTNGYTLGIGSNSKKVVILDSDFSAGGPNSVIGIRAERLKLIRSNVIGYGDQGLWVGGKCVIKDSSIQGSGLSGAFCFDKIIARRSTISGNGNASTCGVSEMCADLDTVAKPTVDPASTCETSYQSVSGIPGSSWNICSLD